VFNLGPSGTDAKTFMGQTNWRFWSWDTANNMHGSHKLNASQTQGYIPIKSDLDNPFLTQSSPKLLKHNLY
jgi:hypothetical protein